jgi:predicted AAA+ superfamily ATPase
VALRKYYFTDTGLRNAQLNFAFPDEGQLLENVAYNELIYNGCTVNVGCFDSIEKDRGGKSLRKSNEIDFFAVRGTRRYYIQVAAELADGATKSRKLRPFLLLRDPIERILVVSKPVGESLDESGIMVVGAADFLLRFIK